MAEAGFAVHSYDHHGHGLSEPKDPSDRALVNHFNHLVRGIVEASWTHLLHHLCPWDIMPVYLAHLADHFRACIGDLLCTVRSLVCICHMQQPCSSPILIFLPSPLLDAAVPYTEVTQCFYMPHALCPPTASAPFRVRGMHARVQVDDSVQFARSVRARYEPGTPCIAAGQSMGGLVSAQLVLRDQSVWAGLVLCSALIDADWTLILRSVSSSFGDACLPSLHAQ